MKTLPAAIAGAAILALTAPASADTSPRVNQIIVNQALQNQMQNQLNVQQMRLDTQRELTRLSLQNAMQQQNLNLQTLLLEQQLELLRIEQQALAHSRSPASHKTHHHP